MVEYPPKSVWTKPEDRAVLVDTLTIFKDTCEKYGLKRWWLTAGTLLGQVRHGDVIPWDDDADVSVMKSELSILLDLVLPELHGYGYQIVHRPKLGYQVFSPYVRKYPDRGPGTLDIFIVDYNGDSILYACPIRADGTNTEYCGRVIFPAEDIPISWVFPLRYVDFGSVSGFPIPQHAELYLKKVFGDDCLIRAPKDVKFHGWEPFDPSSDAVDIYSYGLWPELERSYIKMPNQYWPWHVWLVAGVVTLILLLVVFIVYVVTHLNSRDHRRPSILVYGSN